MAVQVLSNRDRSPLTREQMQRGIPAAFAEAPHDSRSARYLYVPTIQMLDAMGREGFQPVWASQSRTRNEGKRDYTKHMIRLAHTDAGPLTKLGDTRAEIVLTNSHDGSSSVQLSAGVFRLACLNGLMVGNATEQYRMQHSAKWRDEIIDGTYRVIDNLAGPVTEVVGEMQSRELSRPEQILLAEHAASLRWHTGEPAPVRAEQLLSVRRSADREPTAWNTLNILQENVIRGGIGYRATNESGTRSFRHTREVTGIDDLTRLNRGIWDSVAQLTTGNRVDLAADMFSRLSNDERAQLAMRFAS